MNFPWSRSKSVPVEVAVDNAITSILDGSEAETEAAFHALAGYDAAEVVAELFLQVEDATDGIDVDDLIAAAEIPLPDNPREIVAAIRARDMKALEAATSHDDLNVAVEAILNVIVSLRDARHHIGLGEPV